MTTLDLPPALTTRPLAPGDLPAVAELLAAAEPVDDTGEHEDADDLAEWLLNDFLDLAADTRVVLDGDRVVAYADVLAPPTFRGAFGVQLGGRVHPGWRGRGIGRALLGWQVARAAEVHAERHPELPARVAASLATSMTSAEALARRAGFVAHRWFHSMERPLTDLPDRREVPGVRFVPFAWERDDEVRRAHNASFTEHYGSSERDEASWRTWFTGQRSFRPDLSVLALEDGAVTGYALAYVYDSDTRATGVATTYFGQIGVLPAARGRGLARATIATALHAAAGAGCGQASLGVDSENGSGALRLYEGLGFRTRRTHVTWVRELPPVG